MTPDQDPDTATIPSLPRIFAPPDIRWVSQHIERIHDHARRINHAKTELRNRTNAGSRLLPFVQQFAKEKPYMAGWFHTDLCAMLDDFIDCVENKGAPRIIVSCPPRVGKSEILSRCLPPYILGRKPKWEVIAATYAQDFANEWGLDVRRVMEDPRYLELFPECLPRKDSNRADGFRMAQGGSYVTRGRGGGLTGRGFHVGIIDDIFKDVADVDSEVERKKTKEWYDSVFRTRAAPGAGIIMVGTRWHHDDLIAYVQEQAAKSKDADQWVVYNFPAIATHDEKHRKAGESIHEERRPVAEYKTMRATISPRIFSALYQCNPTPDDGAAFKRDWLKLYKPHELPANLTIYVTTDYALSEKQTADYTVIATWGVAQNGHIYLLKTDRFKAAPAELSERTINACVQVKPRPAPTALIMEDIHITKTLGPQLTARMRERNVFVPLKTYTPTKDKLARSASFRARCEQGMVHFPDEPLTHEVLIPEMLQFPNGKNDDFCLTGDTLVLCSETWKTISQVTTADRVWTRKGLKRVLWSGQTGHAPVVTRAGVTGTSNHPIWTTNRGWVPLGSLLPSDSLVCVESPSGTGGTGTTAIPTPPASNSSGTSITTTLTRWRQSHFIGRCGSTITALSRLVGTSTTSVARTITGRRLCKLFPTPSTENSTSPPQPSSGHTSESGLERNALELSYLREKSFGVGRRNGSRLENGNWLIRRLRSCLGWLGRFVHTVARGMNMTPPTPPRTFARPCAVSAQDTCADTSPVPVFNLTVEDEPEFFANGVLVHNCDNGTLLGLALDELFTPGPAVPPPKPKPAFGTLEWALASMPKNKPDPNARHVPRRLNGQPPERVGRDALLKR